jgi:hypothetical protein
MATNVVVSVYIDILKPSGNIKLVNMCANLDFFIGYSNIDNTTKILPTSIKIGYDTIFPCGKSFHVKKLKMIK